MDAIGDLTVWRAIFTLQRHDPAKVIDSQKRWFPAVPRKPDGGLGGRLDVLSDVRLQDVVRHTIRRTVRVEEILAQIITVITTQVADRAGWFNKYLKVVRGSAHFRSPCRCGKFYARQATLESRDRNFLFAGLSMAKKALCINSHVDTQGRVLSKVNIDCDP